MKKQFLLIAALFSATLLAACSSGGDGGLKTPTSDLTYSVNADSAATMNGETFSFPNGVPAFGTTGTTTVAVNATDGADSFTITSGSNTASGELTYGSCIYRVTSSSFPAGHALANGNTVTVPTCTITVNVRGAPATGSPTLRTFFLNLDGVRSLPIAVTVIVREDGTVLVKGITVGSVSLTLVTGS